MVSNTYFLYEFYGLWDISEEKCDTIVVGSSYARFGLETEIPGGGIKNLSLPSQDIYYGSLIARKIIANNESVKRIVLGVSYTTFFADLSRTRNEKEIGRVSSVYYPLFHDMHNALMIPEAATLKESEIWNIPCIVNTFSRDIYCDIMNKTYFGQLKSRFGSKTCLWKDSSKRWDEIEEDERDKAAAERAKAHNRILEHRDTFCENKKIFNELALLCLEKEIELYVYVFPATKEYRRYINNEFQKQFYVFLNESEYEVHVLDLFQDDNFGVCDFNDMDHLNMDGAKKASEYLYALLGK